MVDLTQYEDEWNDAVVEEDEAPTYEDVPEGDYATTVEKVELKNSQAGNPMLSWILKITGPKHAGRMLFRHNMLMSSQNLVWLKKDLKICGLQLETLSSLPDRLEELLDLKLAVTVKKNGDFLNSYLNEIITETSESESDVPF